MRLVGFHDLQGRDAYQPVIEAHGDRFIAYIGLMGGTAHNALTGDTEFNGTLIVDVTDPAAPLLRHVLWAPKIYMVPRADGRLIIGGTVEERGFDETLTAGGVFSVLEAAWRAVPTIEELPIAEMWVGFRPTSRDDAPLLGPSPVEGLVLATGHHRNGFLLAPATAAAVSRYVLTGDLPAPARPFTLARFAAEPAPMPAARAAGGG